MNTLSNHVLAVLFSWMRTLIQGAWNAMSFGASGGFWPWLGDHWLLVIVLLCLICTVLDYLIWLIRWRPYILWRQRIGRLFHRTADGVYDGGFGRGYREKVDLDLQDMPPNAEQEPEEWEAAVPTPAVPLEAVYPDPEPIGRFPGAGDAPMTEEAVPAAWEETPRTRHRRGERHENRRRNMIAWRLRSEGDALDPQEELPPEEEQESMFHEPVYPRQSPYATWDRNNERDRNG